jgi:hypothetical protein
MGILYRDCSFFYLDFLHLDFPFGILYLFHIAGLLMHIHSTLGEKVINYTIVGSLGRADQHHQRGALIVTEGPTKDGLSHFVNPATWVLDT